jgi:hypothetical protein
VKLASGGITALSRANVEYLLAWKPTDIPPHPVLMYSKMRKREYEETVCDKKARDCCKEMGLSAFTF